MDIKAWILIDTVLMVWNIAFIGIKIFSPNIGFSIDARLALFFIALTFICPIGLIPVGVLPIVDSLEIPRNWFWHLKFSMFSTGDILLVLLFLFFLFRSFTQTKSNSLFIYLSSVFAIFIFFIGLISAYFNSSELDTKNLLNAARSFLCLVIYIYSGFFLHKQYGIKVIEVLSSCLFIIFFISTISMMLLGSEFRAVRYWMPAMLQSQQFVSVIPFFAILFMVKKSQFMNLKYHWRLWYLSGICLLFWGYKAFYIILIVLAFFLILSRMLTLLGRNWGWIVFFIIVFSQPLLLYFNSVFFR